MAQRYDGLLIDFYGTICAGDREAVERACTRIVDEFRLPLSAGDFAIAWGRQFFGVIDRSNHADFRTLHECEKISLEVTLGDFGVRADPAPWVAELEAYWRDPPIYPDAVEFLRQVQLPVCCVSNADTEPLLKAIDKHDLHFDAVVSSEAVRCYKPDRAIFQRALQKMNLSADRAVHIGDSLHSDVGGATSAGIAAVWVRRESRIHDIGKCQPLCTISSMAELATVLSL